MFGRMKDPVDGTATVVGYSERHEQKGDRVVLNAQVIVEANGMASATVDAKPEVPQSWMPVKTGTTWPVRVDRANPSRLKFLWERVQPPAGATPAPAASSAPAPAAVPVAQAFQGFSLPPQVQVYGGTMADAKQAIDMAEQAMGMDLDGDGKIAGGREAPTAGWAGLTGWSAMGVPTSQPGGAPPASGPVSDDPVAKLERLAKLLDEGAITREEFDAQKKKILGEI
jgi:hypothetical protein